MKILLIGNQDKNSGGPANVMHITKKYMQEIYEDEISIIDSKTVNFREFIKEILDVDLIHLHELWNLNIIRCAKIAENFGVPYIFTFHGFLNKWSLKKNQLIKKIYLKIFENQIFNKSSAFHILSEEEFNEIKIVNNDIKDKTFLLCNGAEINKNTPISIVEKKKSKEKKSLKLLFLGRLDEKKGLDVLIRAFQIIKRKKLDIKLKIVGPLSNYGEKIKRQIIKYQLENYISLRGPIYLPERKKKLYERNDFFILPSHDEADAMSIKESLSNGLPIIITDQCKFGDVESKKIGFKINHNPEEIVRKLIIINNKFDNNYNMIENSLEYAKSNFNIYNIIKIYRQNLIEIASGVKYSSNWKN